MFDKALWMCDAANELRVGGLRFSPHVCQSVLTVNQIDIGLVLTLPFGRNT